MNPFTSADVVALRRLTLAVSVLDEIDLEPHAHGVRLVSESGQSGHPVASAVLDVGWDDIATSLRGARPDTETARRRLCLLLRVRQALGGHMGGDAAARLRPLGLPVTSAVHPGDDWTQLAVMGGAMSWGPGVLLRHSAASTSALDHVDEMVVPVSRLTLLAAGVRVDWPGLHSYLERMGQLAADRLVREPTVLKPMGDCDVVTLLASRTLREALAARDGSGLCAAVVPMRRRGWLDPSRTDPAFARAAAAATEEDERGFERPILVTADEVGLAVAGVRPAEIVLRDPAVATSGLRPVQWRPMF